MSCYLTGWGIVEPDNIWEDTSANILQEVETKAISTSQCEHLWRREGYTIKDSHICFYDGQHSACQGDSGGPAVCKVDGSWVLAGVTSGGSPVCNVKKPSICPRVSAFRDWINEHSGL